MAGTFSSDPDTSRYWHRLLDRINILLRRPEHRRPTCAGFEAWAAWNWRQRHREHVTPPARTKSLVEKRTYMREFRRKKAIEAGLRPRRPRANSPAEKKQFRKQFRKGTYRPRVERPWHPPSERQLAARARLAHFTVRKYEDDDYDPDYSPERVKARLAQLQKQTGRFSDDEDY